ncbi:unnamed protein product [Microthlaspi erraticum]|uniref:Uncharacterized protein n=1 Tax=Microthlaspi erraticum TaxID=1685480 RepID=A0A6D2KFK3_9BRAS|nr:unnamed protein product [Microthlaspi erraticum]
MGSICELSDDLLVKIISFLPLKVAVSTSILSKQWEFLWMWLPKPKYELTGQGYVEFIDKNLQLHGAPVIESLLIVFGLLKPEKIKLWVDIAVSRFLRELSIRYLLKNGYALRSRVLLSLPISLYTCVSLMTLKLDGKNIAVDVPQTVCLPSLTTLELKRVKYSNEDSLGLLLSHCPVLEVLLIKRSHESDNVRALVVDVPSLKWLSLKIGEECSSDGSDNVIVTPSLKYFRIKDCRDSPTYLLKPMTKLEEAEIDVKKDIEKILELITFVRRLRLRASSFNSVEEFVYPAGIVFNQLEHLKLDVCNDYWSKFLIWLLGNSPKLRVLILYVYWRPIREKYELGNWESKQSSVPECFLRSLETFEYSGYMGKQEEKDFLSFVFKHACCLKLVNKKAP